MLIKNFVFSHNKILYNELDKAPYVRTRKSTYREAALSSRHDYVPLRWYARPSKPHFSSVTYHRTQYVSFGSHSRIRQLHDIKFA